VTRDGLIIETAVELFQQKLAMESAQRASRQELQMPGSWALFSHLSAFWASSETGLSVEALQLAASYQGTPLAVARDSHRGLEAWAVAGSLYTYALLA